MDSAEYQDVLDGALELLTSSATLYDITQVQDDTGATVDTEVAVAGSPFPCGVGPASGRETVLAGREVAVADATLYFLPTAPVARTQVAYVTDQAWVGSRRFVFLGVTRVSGQPALVPVAAQETN